LAICANGALVYDLSTEKILASFPLADEVARELVARLRAAVPGVGFASESIDGDFAREAAYRPRLWPMTEAVADVDELFRRPLAKLLARHEEFDSDRLLEAAREVIGAEIATMTHSSGDGLLEISAVGVSKATTLAAVAAERGRSAEHTIAFGDMPNDLPMLAWAGHSVAVANAHPDVLAAADEVTASVEDDGVAQVLERYFPA
jgi:HAD superfamily hydrolase (TIGR01484 family)